MSKLTLWVHQKGLDFLELAGGQDDEAEATTHVRIAAWKHFKHSKFRPLSRKLYICEAVAFATVLIYSQFADLNETALNVLPMLLIMAHAFVMVFKLIIQTVIDTLFIQRVVAISCKCSAEELPDWVVRLPELCYPCEDTRWVLLEFKHCVYALSLNTLDLISGDDAFREYLTQF